MTARVYTFGDWLKARDRRARSGKAPRLAVRRVIMLRERRGGDWYVALYVWRFGRWSAPEVICEPSPLNRARAAALDAWERLKLPTAFHYAGEPVSRPLRFGCSGTLGDVA